MELEENTDKESGVLRLLDERVPRDLFLDGGGVENVVPFAALLLFFLAILD